MNALVNEDNHIDAAWRKLAGQLHRHFEVTAQHRCLLWVDPAQADPFEGHDSVEQLRVRIPIRHPRFNPLRAPYVVPLDLSRSADGDLFNSSVELGWRSWSTEYLNAMLGQPVCGWVRAAVDARAVTRHWGTQCHLHLFKRQTRLCRFHDPSVREWLWPTLDKTQQRALLGPAAEILAIGRTQQLIHHTCGDPIGFPSSSSNSEQGRFPQLQLDQRTWEQLDDYATVHAAWLIWRNSADSQAALPQAAGWQRHIFHALAQASQLGIRDAPERELFALHALQMGADFYRNSELDGIWRQTRAGGVYGITVEEVMGCPADQLATKIKRFLTPEESTHG